MGSIRRRLSRLEKQEKPGWGCREERVLAAALERVSTEDLRLLAAYLDRGDGEYADPTEEEAAAVVRLEEHLGEVTNGH